MVLEILTERGWINPVGKSEWEGLYDQIHYEDKHLILWATDPETWKRLHEIPCSHFRVDGETPSTKEIR